LDKPIVVNVAPVHDNHCAAFKTQSPRDRDVACLPGCDHSKRRQVSIMIQKHVQLNGALCPSELCPVEKRKRQVDGAGVQADELILKPELLSDSSSGHSCLAFGQELLEHRLIKRPWPVRIGIGKSGPARRIRNAQVFEFPLAAGQSPADLTKAMCAAELAEQHCNELPPAAEPLGGVVGAMLLNRLFEFHAREQLQ